MDAHQERSTNSQESDREQFTGCFKCGKYDHIVKNCPLLKEEQEQEQFQNKAENRVETVLQTGLQIVLQRSSQRRCLWLGVTQLRMMKPLRKKKLL